MSWFKVDDAFAFHAKTVKAGNEAVGVWVRLGAWTSANLEDGFVPEHVAMLIAGSTEPLDALVGCGKNGGPGLLLRVEGGFQLHDFLDYNPTATEVRAERERQREQRSAAGRASAAKRAGQRNGNGPLNGPLNENATARSTEPQRDGNENSTPSRPVPSRPVPSPPTSSGGSAERVVVEIFRAELRDRFDDLPDPFAVALQLLQAARVDRADAPDRREVIRHAARVVGSARKVDNVVGLLHAKVVELIAPGALERHVAALAKVAARESRDGGGDAAALAKGSVRF